MIEYEPHEGLFAKLRRFFSGGAADAPLSGEGAAVDAPAGSAEGRDESFGRNGTRRVSSGSTTWSAPPLSQEERALVAKGNRPRASALYRDRTGVADWQAVRVVEAQARWFEDMAGQEEPASAPDSHSPAPSALNPPDCLPGLNEEEIRLIDSGRLIGAVASFRRRTGCSLADAKAAVDSYRGV
ncbi:MAG: hypothetical protein SPH79_04210 [Schaalia hyovaginalis]|uniref:hypothetical protein n=1 Tax=Schaalia hyovaginalis TaxID=29316 RepID=UPI002A909632|nr:hypothetical protein [Schaalia hyovaginalis]MDY6213674.1 hypothetical protein [Schaalia hyovaginalis]